MEVTQKLLQWALSRPSAAGVLLQDQSREKSLLRDSGVNLTDH